MQRKLLGIAIIALLPFTSAFAAPGCPQVRESVNNGTDLQTAMDNAVSNNQCSPAEAAAAGSSLATTASERNIVSAFRAANGLDGNNRNAGGQRSGGGQISINTGFGGSNGGGGGAASVQ